MAAGVTWGNHTFAVCMKGTREMSKAQMPGSFLDNS